MLEKMSLPPLAEFNAVLKGFNIKRNFQYLLYFAKNQQRIYSISPDLADLEVSETNTPTQAHRDFIIKHLADILLLEEGLSWEKGPNGENKLSDVLILSAQRFIMGLIMMGHVHIYEILIRELMPAFIKIIQRESHSDHLKQETHIKIKQFCMETITLLAMWFPKSFYDPSTASWFKKAIAKYEIAVKFIVYYTNDKIDNYERTIMELRLYQGKSQCAQCKYCLEMSGKNYYFLRNIPDIPSIIEEEEHEGGGSSIRYNKRIATAEKKKTYTTDSAKKLSYNLSNIPLESKMQSNIQTSDFEEKQISNFSQKQSSSSKLSQRIRKHREQRKEKSKKSMVKNSLKSRLEYFNEKSKISQEEAVKDRKQYSTSHSKNYYRDKEQKSSNNENDSNENSKESIKESLKGVLSEGNISSVKNKFQSYKEKQKNRYKFLNKGTTNSKSKYEPQTEKILPTYNSNQEDIYEISPTQYMLSGSQHSSAPYSTAHQKSRLFCVSVFQSELYKNMQKTTRKLFRKQCFKLHKKRLVSVGQPWTLEIKCKPKGKKMELKVQLLSDYANNLGASLIQPKHPEILLKELNNLYFFSFERGFLPIIFRIHEEEVILPITLISMLEPLQSKDYFQSRESEISISSTYTIAKVQFKLDTELFKNIYNVAKCLKFSEEEIDISKKRGSLTKKYLFFGEVVVLDLDELPESENQIQIKVHHKQLRNDEKVYLLLKQIKKCTQRAKAAVKKVKQSEGRKNLGMVEADNKVLIF